MKRALTLLAPAALAACLACPPALAQAAAPVSPVPAAVSSAAQQFTLKNGMQLIVQPDRRAPTAVHMVWVRVGSMDEVDGTSGVAHVVEHMMFKGSDKVAPGDFSRKVAALGGRENAFTNRDYTGYYQQIPADKLRKVMALEADRFAHNQWPDAEFTKEIEVVKEERRMRTEDNPRSMLIEQLMATVFQSSPYRRPVVGWMDDLDAMTPDDVRQFQKAGYVPANAASVIAGDVDPEQVKEWKEACISANDDAREKSAHESKELREERRAKEKLEKELARKEKALAEAAALLVLRKKANAIWGTDEEDE